MTDANPTRPDRETMIRQILENPDPGATIHTRAELEAMDDTRLWCIWLRS